MPPSPSGPKGSVFHMIAKIARDTKLMVPRNREMYLNGASAVRPAIRAVMAPAPKVRRAAITCGAPV
ncbi:MAG: hypothetical protein A4E30_00672 [Methanomassiliicoccales archaeon PtaB.Bin215]|nr:MAG: hypothetical protein A4E30_00672 [Methanomassiliicoccales archaeon PtaB.Bin215]